MRGTFRTLIITAICALLGAGILTTCGDDDGGGIGNIPTAVTTWENTFGGTGEDGGSAVLELSDGSFIIVGYTYSLDAGGPDVFLVKADSTGNGLWNSTFGGINNDIGEDINVTSDDSFIITGRTDSFGAGYYDSYLISADSGGNELWSHTFGTAGIDSSFAVQETWDKGFIMAGSTSSYGDSSSSDFYLVKTDGSGDKRWAKTYDGLNCDQSYSMQETSDKGFIMVGSTNCGGFSTDVYLVKADLDGNKLWSKTYGGSSTDYGRSVKQSSDGGYIVLGNTESYGVGGNDIYLIKTDSSGNELWSKTFGGDDLDVGSQVRQTSDGGYIIVGSTRSFGNANGKDDVYLIKTDVNGNEAWSKTFGGIDYDNGYSVQETSDGGFIIAGSTMSYGAGGWDIYIIKTDSNGNVH